MLISRLLELKKTAQYPGKMFVRDVYAQERFPEQYNSQISKSILQLNVNGFLYYDVNNL